VIPDSDEILRAKLNAETGRLAWTELQRHFARGAVVKVAPGVDLVEVALGVARNDQAMVAGWLGSGQISRASSEDASDWHDRDAHFWAVVTAPWVLVQEIASSDSPL
jgi:hypothetical protein